MFIFDLRNLDDGWIVIKVGRDSVKLVAWFRENLVRLRLVCDFASCFAASDQRLLLLRTTTVAASARVL